MNVNTGYKKVVFIDDDKELVQVYNSMLAKKNLDDYFIYFDNARDGINYLKNSEPDAFPDYILLDLYMPEMNGFDFLQFIDHVRPLKDAVEIYVCTSSRRKDDRNRVMKYPFVSAYLEKPLSSDFLELLIRDHSC